MKPPKKFFNLEALREEINRNYRGAEVGDKYNGKYRVVSVGEGTLKSISERLTARNETKLIYLIAEEINE